MSATRGSSDSGLAAEAEPRCAWGGRRGAGGVREAWSRASSGLRRRRRRRRQQEAAAAGNAHLLPSRLGWLRVRHRGGCWLLEYGGLTVRAAGGLGRRELYLTAISGGAAEQGLGGAAGCVRRAAPVIANEPPPAQDMPKPCRGLTCLGSCDLAAHAPAQTRIELSVAWWTVRVCAWLCSNSNVAWRAGRAPVRDKKS